jgi:hypothetical protein
MSPEDAPSNSNTSRDGTAMGLSPILIATDPICVSKPGIR